MTQAFNSGCPCCAPRGVSRRQFLGTTAALAAAPAFAALGGGEAMAAPINNAVGAVVTSMGPQNVDTVLIGGKVVKRSGKLVGVDMRRIAKLGQDAQARAYNAAGIENKRI